MNLSVVFEFTVLTIILPSFALKVALALWGVGKKSRISFKKVTNVSTMGLNEP